MTELLQADISSGLDGAEAARRLEHYGPNVVSTAGGPGALMRFLLQFHQPLIYILMAAAGVTLLLGEYIDAAVIAGVVLVNALVGYIQESRAVRALDALSRSVTTMATVLRDGERRTIPSAEVVPGDIVVVQSGDKVPADLRLLRVRNLQVDESALTGESVPVEKAADPVDEETPLADRTSMAYASTLVTYGQATGVVVSTGLRTEVGNISELISSAEDIATPLTKQISAFSRILLVVILVLAGVTFAVGLLRGEAAHDMFLAAVALAVGAIPEGLPAAVTITLAIGVNRMASRRAVIRRMPAVETLGSTTVICSDKTGTLTQNQMTVQHLVAGRYRYDVSGSGYEGDGEVRPFEGESPPECNEALRLLLLSGYYCNDSALVDGENGYRSVRGDPTEAALIVAAEKSTLLPDAPADGTPGSTPSPSRATASTWRPCTASRTEGKPWSSCKGRRRGTAPPLRAHARARRQHQSGGSLGNPPGG
ncbi:MAG: HAD-IC family P-type ATPase [Dehalococcoidia bacterium]|nr:HAD-IC family P-type ATPase [Dehalococcoidia bacterium]